MKQQTNYPVVGIGASAGGLEAMSTLLDVEHALHGMALLIVQDPGTAEFDGMPRSAVNTGLADLVLPIEKISKVLGQLAAHPHRLTLGATDGKADDVDSATWQKVLTVLHDRYTSVAKMCGVTRLPDASIRSSSSMPIVYASSHVAHPADQTSNLGHVARDERR